MTPVYDQSEREKYYQLWRDTEEAWNKEHAKVRKLEVENIRVKEQLNVALEKLVAEERSHCETLEMVETLESQLLLYGHTPSAPTPKEEHPRHTLLMPDDDARPCDEKLERRE